MTNTHNTPPTRQLRLLRLPEVIHLTALCRSSIYEKMKQRSFPQTIAIGSRSVAWNSLDIDNWIDEQIQKSEVLQDA
jgi:prophage regulatory protein